jgi:hypothetical protein
MSFPRCELGFALLAFAALPAVAQDSRREWRPEFDLYVSDGERVRFVFENRLTESSAAGYTQGSFQASIDVAMRPLFRRRIRRQPDVFRNRYLTFRTGYRYLPGVNNGKWSAENRMIAEFTTRYPLPLGIVLRDRSRGDFRFVHGQPFSARYRNRLWVERDLVLGKLAVTPYVYDEIYFDGRYGAWTTNRVVLGMQFPVSKWVIEPYILRQHNTRSTPFRIDAFGLKVSLFL